jgi:soluble lytic murein transglycosylase-like protein
MPESIDYLQDVDSFLPALIQTESSGDPGAVNEATGARGLAQITPIAWKDLVQWHPEKYGGLDYERDIFNPEVATEAARDYLAIIMRYLDNANLPVNLDNVLASYNWGIGNLKEKGLNKAPKETREYIAKIRALLEQ